MERLRDLNYKCHKYFYICFFKLLSYTHLSTKRLKRDRESSCLCGIRRWRKGSSLGVTDPSHNLMILHKDIPQENDKEMLPFYLFTRTINFTPYPKIHNPFRQESKWEISVGKFHRAMKMVLSLNSSVKFWIKFPPVCRKSSS